MRRILRGLGAILMLAGLGLFAYAAFSYVQITTMEKAAEAHIPGQETDLSSPSPTFLPNSSTNSAPTAAPPVLMPDLSEGSVPPLMPLVQTTPAPQATEPDTSTPLAAPTEIGTTGLPRGSGANPTRLIIPRLGLDTRVEEAGWATVNENGQPTSEWQVPFDAVGHLLTTAKPGEAGNVVISGHHNLIGPNEFGLGKFAGLWNLKVGDSVYLFDAVGRVFRYRIARSLTFKEEGEPLAVREEHAREMFADDGTPIVTFETCWNGTQAPLSGNTYRWLVIASLAGTVPADQIPNAFSNAR